ncbi:tandem-95 repeat protein [Spirosoma sp. HMF4905]|uniref:Tandem-95 repeat protein n=1 Tax=Spirosoma arboris TaxID=2682092 RepID=A0A7K1SCU4_9BACT|nr:Ig-like domain-containing protein [Spirosoma arboris]MVM31634.1 tandem-95 repeat protein [Spirosoma arboris]
MKHYLLWGLFWMLSAVGALAQQSPNTVKYKVTYDATTQTYTAWVVPDYATPNTNNIGAIELASTAQFTLKVPVGFVISNITDATGAQVWDKNPAKLGPGLSLTAVNGTVFTQDYSPVVLDPTYGYYVIGKAPTESNLGAFVVGVPVALFTFKGNGCFGPISPLAPSYPFIQAAVNAYSFNVGNSFYSFSGQPAGGNQDPLEQFINITGSAASCTQSQPPIAKPDIANTRPATPVSGNVLINDVDPQGLPLTVSTTPVCQPAHGSVTLTASGSYTYTPASSYTGVDGFCYQVCNSAGQCATTTVGVNVIPDPYINPAIDNPPVANNDATQTTQNNPVIVVVLANDTDPDKASSGNGQLSNPVLLGQPSSGTAVVNANGTVTYTPTTSFTGVVTFPYQVCDKASSPLCATALVTITVLPTPPNNTTLSPVAVDDALITSINTPKTGSVASNDSDPNTPALSLTFTTGQPLSGTVVMSPTGSYTYTPPTGFSGPTSFTYTVCNSAGKCNVATVSVIVQKTADLPPIVTPDIANTNINTPVSGNLLTNDVDPQGLPLTTSLINSPTSGTVTLSPTGSYTYTPPTGFTGVASFCYLASNTAGLSASTCVTINVIPAPVQGNNPPVPNADATQTTQDTPVPIAVLANDTDPDLETSLNGQLKSPPTLVSQPSFGTAVVNGNGTITYTPPANFTGVVTFPYRVCDLATLPLCATALVTVNVLPTPPAGTILAPVAGDDALLTRINTPKSGDVAPNDLDPNSPALPLTFSAGQPTSGTVVMSSIGIYTYTPQLGFVGPTSFTYTACNSAGKCDVATVSISVEPNPGQLPPSVTPDIANTNIGTPVRGNVLTNDSDPNTPTLPLTASVTTLPTVGTVVMTPAGSYTYTPPANFTGVVSFCYTASNTAGLSASTCVTINVIPDLLPNDNNRPVANNDATRTSTGLPVTVAVLANDTDPDSNTSGNGQLSNPTLISLTQPSVGTVVVNANGTVTYTPPANFTGVVTFPYQVCDQATTPLCATALVTVTVQPTPPDNTTLAPVAVDDALLTRLNTPATGNVSTNDRDPQGLPLTFTTGQPGSGTVVMSPTGSYTYTPAPGFVGPTSFTYSVCNSASKCIVATVSVDVQQSSVKIGFSLRLKVMLQGALIGGSNGLMRDDLRSKGFLPLTEPYSAIGGSRFTQVNGGGGETMPASATIVNAGTANAIVDWVFVELRSPSNLSLVVATHSALVQRDGDVVMASDGVSSLSFTSLTAGNYYVSVKHRNHLGAMTATAIPLSVTGTVVDFTSMTNTELWNTTIGIYNYDGWEQTTVSGKQALWAGNSNRDGKVKYQGVINDLIPIFTEVIGAQSNSASPVYNYDNAFGYYFGDVNMDGKVKYQGTSNDTSLIFTNVLTNYQTLNTGQLYNFDFMLEQIP